MPNWFVSTNSQLLDAFDRMSDETDVAICNQYQAFCQPEGGILIIDGVDLVVQVKAILDDTELDRAFSSCLTVKNLKRSFRVGETVFAPQSMPTDWYVYTPYIVLAFSSKLKGETLHQRLREKSDPVELPNQPDALFVLDRGLSFINCRDGRGTDWKQKDELCKGWIKMESGESTRFEFIRFMNQIVSYVLRQRPPLSLYFPSKVDYPITSLVPEEAE